MKRSGYAAWARLPRRCMMWGVSTGATCNFSVSEIAIFQIETQNTKHYTPVKEVFMEEAVIVSAVRTPLGSFNGTLGHRSDKPGRFGHRSGN